MLINKKYKLNYLENVFHLADTSFKARWRSKPWGEHPAGNAGSGLLRRLEGIQPQGEKREETTPKPDYYENHNKYVQYVSESKTISTTSTF